MDNKNKKPQSIGEILWGLSPADVVGDFSETERTLERRDLADDLWSERYRLDRLREAHKESDFIDPITLTELRSAAQRLGEVASDHLNSQQE